MLECETRRGTPWTWHQRSARTGDSGRIRHRPGDIARLRARGRQGARLRRRSAALAAAAKSDPVLTQSVCDVSDRAQVAQLFDDALKGLGGLDCLVNNAGIAGPTGKVEEINPEDWDRCLAVDITGQFNCVRLAVPHLKQSKNASIMNLSSQAGKHGFPLRSPYAAAKWGVIGFTKSIAIELGAYGIRVNALLPGLVAGDRIRRVIEAKAQQAGIAFTEQEPAMFRSVSLKDYVTPQQLADMVVFSATRAPRPFPARPSPCAATPTCG